MATGQRRDFAAAWKKKVPSPVRQREQPVCRDDLQLQLVRSSSALSPCRAQLCSPWEPFSPQLLILGYQLLLGLLTGFPSCDTIPVPERLQWGQVPFPEVMPESGLPSRGALRTGDALVLEGFSPKLKG